ncbi:MAG: carboxypeptidase regulatory-like domain-containing protein [Deltaproteobacteria bacterium]|nr:carboxypeptidase regulatory-like domain-containing protein [Deltaproteobacteria bacterium]
MHRALITLVLSLSLAAPALAGNNLISGAVSDRNGQPVARAQVRLVPEDPAKGTFLMVTDPEGRFLIDYLREADGDRSKLARKTRYQLEIFKPGYHVLAQDFYYKRGEVHLDTITLVEDTVRIEETPIDLSGNLERGDTGSGGGSYEGQ